MKKSSCLNGYNDTLSGFRSIVHLASIIISSFQDSIKMKNERRIGGFKLTAMVSHRPPSQ